MVKDQEVLGMVGIFTDGACSGNPGPGGWACIIRTGDEEKMLTGGDSATTKQRMEVMSAIAALEYPRHRHDTYSSLQPKEVARA